MDKVSLLIGPVNQLVTAKSIPWKHGDPVIIMEEAGIAINGHEIIDVGPWGEISKRYEGKCSISAEDSLVTASLIDPHTHLLFAGSRENELELRLQCVTYDELLKRGGGI